MTLCKSLQKVVDDYEKESGILWIKCSERMPPDDDTWIIIKDGYGLHRAEGKSINSDYGVCVMLDAEWTPYTEEAWKELNG